MQYSLLDAAYLAQAAYDPKFNARTKDKLVKSLDHKGVQAHILSNRTLLITGSNGVDDYINYNLKVFNLFGEKYRFSDETVEAGHSRAMWHQGFLKHARIVYEFAKPFKPNFIIGHSLGGASAQILAKSFGVPAIGFASPRTQRKRSAKIKGEEHSLTLWRVDDTVPHMPPGFRHLGRSIGIGTKVNNPGMDHSMEHYIPLIKTLAGDPRVPDHWPL
ncbi:lipase family protein [Cochlodiniinecator piscidefendens]|uniref:lipase family protein n=1 Tax=Cochlodiniinecator piscidefendens TaxID=2715756 RepID=UPI001408F20E|nr:hypothetical protein [Cochlodiniinecator piscidefendens]